ncbi:aldolase/citrate lyase family protein [Variovorax sp. dw_954]|uniref:HpcH/HpaI aldolase family protein n=1 Tax=Variovorax sp. dw_954 TaxID=2720078 RepID=UPI001BD65AAA|nr:aldolase/citrate lyase family protein [Variovorax sp. dw_954]
MNNDTFHIDPLKIPNHVKRAAASGDAIRGVHLTFPAPTVIEVLSAADLQFIYIDGEHGCFDGRDIEAACMAAERHRLTLIARVPDLSAGTITRFMDRGVKGIVAPHIETLKDARQVVNAAYFGPIGARSFGAGRPEHGMRIGDRTTYMQACNDAVSVCLMLESRAGLALAGELAAIEGVDYLSFGMLDLAQDMGHPGRADHPEVKAAVADATRRIVASGKRVREHFMKYVWINEVIVSGARQMLDNWTATVPYGGTEAAALATAGAAR